MAHNIKLRAIRNVAESEYIKEITNPRIVVVGILVVFIHSFAVLPLLARAEKYGGKLNLFEPFIAIANSGVLALFLPIVFIILISDFPTIDGNTLLLVHRTGKINWFLGQQLYILMSICSYLVLIFVSCCAMSKGIFCLNWSDTITKYDATFPEEAGGFVSRLLPSNLYNQIPVMIALTNIILLLVLRMFVIALFLCLMKMLYLRTAGLFLVVVVIAVGALTCSLEMPSMWCFPTANSLIWLHYDKLFKKPIIPVWNSYVYFGVLAAVLFADNLIVLGKLQFRNTEQE